MKTNKLTIGILAHVDAGKTTLAESILYKTGQIRKLGRVDHKNAFLDTDVLERSRGITIFSKQANFCLNERKITLLDTPGHIDFSAEMERTLQVLDYAILVISGADGVQSHIQTLWKLLDTYHIPVFLFINKMDQQGTEKNVLLRELQNRLNTHCIDFSVNENSETFMENIAVCDEVLLEKYLENESISKEDIRSLIENRKLFPCYFGSALKLEGIDSFLEGLYQYTDTKDYGEEFGAKVYKISRDPQGNRLSHLKITGGTLKVKEKIKGEEKVEQIRIYSGASYQPINEATAGSICAVTGLSSTKAGEGIGNEIHSEKPVLEPVLTYRLLFPDGCDMHGMFLNLKQLEEEEPELHIVWDKESGEIHAQVMGEIQLEILKSLISERFHTDVSFGQGQIIYKETIKNMVEGAGHFEPLRHYAEVRLRLEPADRGSGLHFSAECSEDVLNRNWQRLILTHLEEKQHRGVLTGSEITDMNIILTTGKAHIKHTEGGDFRQATYRAVRQGLKRAESILLDPVYEYRLEVPSEMIGRAMSDLQRMQADFSLPETEGEISVLTGTAPVINMQEYQKEVLAYTKGHGRLFCSLKGYEPCHNAEEVIEKMQYDSEADLENPTGSVFCSHGAGFNVSWDKVEEYMHTSSQEKKVSETVSHESVYLPPVIDEEELLEIFERTYGPVKRKKNHFKKQISSLRTIGKPMKKREYEKEYLLVDGYNIIFAWEDLKELSEVNIEGARNKLMDILSNYQGYRQCTLILVFDAYKVSGNIGEVQKYHNIHVVYTKEAETADQYIEKTVHELGKQYKVTVATSDGMEQMIIMGQGANRLSAKGLLEEILIANEEIRNEHLNQTIKNKQYLFDNISDDTAEYIERIKNGE